VEMIAANRRIAKAAARSGTPARDTPTKESGNADSGKRTERAHAALED